jgi:hypothetical protein
MPQTTTAQNACDAVIYLDNDGGVLTDVSGSTNQVTVGHTLIVGEQRTFGNDWPIRLTCGKDSSLSFVALYSTTGDEAWDIVKGWFEVYDGAARTVRVDMPDASAGSDRLQGEFILSEYNYDLMAGEGAPVLVNATLLPSGQITLSEIGT